MVPDVYIELPDGDPELNPAFSTVAGVSVLSRLILGAQAVGAETITVCGAQAGAAQQRFGDDPRFGALKIQWVVPAEHEGPLPPGGAGVRVTANVVMGNPVWRLLAEAEGAVSVPGTSSIERTFGSGEVATPLWSQDAPKGAFVVSIESGQDKVRARKSRAAAKRAIFRNVTKPTSGPVSRHINARISIPITRVLCEFGVTPNQMTVFTTLLGLVSAWYIAQGTFMDLAVGGLLFQLCAALDRVDGELARSGFMASERGAWIDTVGDNLVYLAAIVGLNLGYYRYGLSYDWPFVDWIPVAGIGISTFAFVMIAGMGWYLYTNDRPGTMTAVHRDLATKLDASDVGWTYRILDSMTVLGKRDSFSLIAFILTTIPLATDSAIGYHVVVGFADLLIVLIGLFYALGLIRARRMGAYLASTTGE